MDEVEWDKPNQRELDASRITELEAMLTAALTREATNRREFDEFRDAKDAHVAKLEAKVAHQAQEIDQLIGAASTMTSEELLTHREEADAARLDPVQPTEEVLLDTLRRARIAQLEIERDLRDRLLQMWVDNLKGGTVGALARFTVEQMKTSLLPYKEK